MMEFDELLLFILVLMGGIVLGAAAFEAGSTASNAYALAGRVCIKTTTFDPCLTRTLEPQEAKRIADEINKEVGREWRGIK